MDCGRRTPATSGTGIVVEACAVDATGTGACSTATGTGLPLEISQQLPPERGGGCSVGDPSECTWQQGISACVVPPKQVAAASNGAERITSTSITAANLNLQNIR